jgi:1-acyl-sn-glycerol-3-phosphate acyltransferase
VSQPTWTGDHDYPTMASIGPAGWAVAILRAVPIALLVFGGCVVLLALRILIERPIHGVARPWTPHITQFACRNALRLMGIRFVTKGTPMTTEGAVVANHASWLDIFVLNARKRVYFVSKAEVAKWPGIGWLARTVGTVFIARDRKEAKAQRDLFERRLSVGHKLLFFPEGTSTDSLRVLPFKPTLFEAFFSDQLRDMMHIQPVTVNYVAPQGADPRFYGWWGDMGFGDHMLHILAATRQGRVEVIYHDPVAVTDFENRKVLAKYLEETVRSGLFVTGEIPVEPPVTKIDSRV